MSRFPRTVEELEQADSISNYRGTVRQEITGLWKVQVREPPFDEPTLTEEFLGVDVTPDIIEKQIGDRLRELTKSSQRAKILYFWKMKAVTESGAKLRARTLTRALHLTTPDVINTRALDQRDGEGRVIVITGVEL